LSDTIQNLVDDLRHKMNEHIKKRDEKDIT